MSVEAGLSGRGSKLTRTGAPPVVAAPGCGAAQRLGPGIHVESVSKCFFHGATPVQALKNITLDVEPGEFVSLIGPSGCGKSTLLRVIGGLSDTDTGSVLVGDRSAEQARSEKTFGFVPQTPCLLPWRTVLENVTLLRDVGTPSKASRAMSGFLGSVIGRHSPASAGKDPEFEPMQLLQQVGLGAFARSHPGELSGGMQQRVSLVRAFALGAPILLMDEPFAALDEITRDAMRYQLLEIWGSLTKTVVFVTHSIPEAVILSDRVVTMAGGPGRIIDLEHIELPRPRTVDMEFSPEFSRHAQHLRGMLREGWS